MASEETGLQFTTSEARKEFARRLASIARKMLASFDQGADGRMAVTDDEAEDVRCAAAIVALSPIGPAPPSMFPIVSVPMVEPQETMQAPQDGALYVVVDKPPGPEPSRFLDIEDAQGRSVYVGEWEERPNGTWALRITAAG